MNNNFNKFAFNDAMILDKIQEILERAGLHFTME